MHKEQNINISYKAEMLMLHLSATCLAILTLILALVTRRHLIPQHTRSSFSGMTSFSYT
jgi:hypothetical protein